MAIAEITVPSQNGPPSSHPTRTVADSRSVRDHRKLTLNPQDTRNSRHERFECVNPRAYEEHVHDRAPAQRLPKNHVHEHNHERHANTGLPGGGGEAAG